MRIDFYKSSICPRCMVAGFALKKLKRRYPGLELNAVEVTRNFRTAWNEGVPFIPALKIDGELLWGVFLTPKMVRRFVEKHLKKGRQKVVI